MFSRTNKHVGHFLPDAGDDLAPCFFVEVAHGGQAFGGIHGDDGWMKGCDWGVTCRWGGEGCSSSPGKIMEVVGGVVESRLVLVLPTVIWIAATEDEEQRLEEECQAIVVL